MDKYGRPSNSFESSRTSINTSSTIEWKKPGPKPKKEMVNQSMAPVPIMLDNGRPAKDKMPITLNPFNEPLFLKPLKTIRKEYSEYGVRVPEDISTCRTLPTHEDLQETNIQAVIHRQKRGNQLYLLLKWKDSEELKWVCSDRLFELQRRLSDSTEPECDSDMPVKFRRHRGRPPRYMRTLEVALNTPLLAHEGVVAQDIGPEKQLIVPLIVPVALRPAEPPLDTLKQLLSQCVDPANPKFVVEAITTMMPGTDGTVYFLCYGHNPKDPKLSILRMLTAQELWEMSPTLLGKFLSERLGEKVTTRDALRPSALLNDGKLSLKCVRPAHGHPGASSSMRVVPTYVRLGMGNTPLSSIKEED